MTSVRKILESMYCGKCNVIQRIKVVDPIIKQTTFAEATITSEQPCRLSYQRSSIAGNDDVANIVQEIKLFLSPDVSVPSGSKIIVTQNGETETYTNSSKPIVYSDHQEIALKLFERWA